MRPIHKETERRIVQLLEAGESYGKISAKCGVSRFAVYKVVKRELPGREVSKGGRPSKLTQRLKRYCANLITSGAKQNAVEVHKALREDHGVSVHVNTVRNALRDVGLGTIRKPKKPLLRHKNVKDRLEWAKSHVTWTNADWEHVIWSDETKVNRFGSDGHRYAWKRDNEPLQPRHVDMTVKHGGGGLMVWGCITTRGVGPLVKIEGKLTQTSYKKLLQQHLLSAVANHHLEGHRVIFQQDNDPKHTAKSVMQWFTRQEFELLPWPAQSPDLNPIEHIWALLKLRLYRNYPNPPSGMIELWERIQEIWGQITPDECRRYIQTMQSRCQAVIASRGYWTRY